MKKALYGFGLGDDGQFGIRLSASDSGCFSTPQQLFGAPVDQFGVSVVSVACGERHTLMMCADGKVWSVGANDYGQLGRSGSDGSFTIYPVDLSIGTRIIQIDAGQHHSAAVAEDGRLFVWGRNSEYQCAKSNVSSLNKPTRVAEVTEAVQVACGANSCIALQQSGNVFLWGSFLGRNFSTPQVVELFSRIPVVQVSAGDDHFMALTSAGFVYAWGRNEYGQCGSGDTNDQDVPRIVKPLNSMKTVSISCGGNHTVALTKDGRLFAFGYNTFGQLGTGKKEESQPDPQLLAELLGSNVTKVACGRLHTVAVVGGRVFSFGLNSYGQLGAGTLSKTVITPQAVYRLSNITTVFAGYDQTFAIEAPVTDLISCPSAPLETPKFLSMSRLRQLFASKSDNKLDIISELESVFSSPACFNGSFAYTDDRRFNCCPSNVAMNLDDAMYSFNMIANHNDADRLGEIIVNCMKEIFDDRSIFSVCSPSDNPEVCKFLMALPWFHEMVRPEKYYSDLFLPSISYLRSLSRIGPELLRRWWSGLATRHFNRTVLVLMTGVEYQISKMSSIDQLDLIFALRLLKQLYKLNQDLSKIPVDHFYMDSLTKKADIRSDYFEWVTDGSSRMSDSDVLRRPFHFVDFPFLFNAEAKSALLGAEAQYQMYIAAQRPTTALLPMIGFAHIIQPTFKIEVRRDNIVVDTIHALANESPNNFAKPLKVQFVDEEGQDEGGVKKEFFLLLFQQLLQPHYGMFTEDSDSRFVWFSGLDVVELGSFALVGKLCALAVYNAILVDFPFPLALYKKILGQKLTLDDLAMLHPTEGRSLHSLADYDGDDVEDVFALTFQISIDVLGQTVDVELKPGGKDIPVTNENRAEFIKLYIERRLELGVNDHIRNQIIPFVDGFRNVMRSKILDFFQPHELMELMVGNENYDWEVFRKNTMYKDEYHATHPVILAFWDAFFELDLEQRKKFLLFLMGSARIPVVGMEAVKMVIQPVQDSHLYPVAHTCFNLLDLPKITDQTEMKKRLLMCIEHTEGFTLV